MPKKDSAGFLSFISMQKGMMQNMSNDPSTVFQDSIRYIMSGYNIRGKSLTEKDLAKIDLLKSHQVFKERFKDPTDFTFLFVGSFNQDSIKPLIESYIGGISNEMKREVFTPNSIKAPQGQLTKTIYKGNNPRSTVQLMWTGEFDYNRKSRFEMRALANLLNITLRENLREDKGGVYGVGIGPQSEHYPKGSYKFICGFSCAPDNVNKLIDAVKEEINKVKTNGCSEINLGKIKETFLKERETQLKDNNFWLSLIIQSEINKESIKEIEEYNNWINSLKSEDFKKFAKQYFNDNEYKQFVLNPEKK
jgi:zinc protease